MKNNSYLITEFFSEQLIYGFSCFLTNILNLFVQYDLTVFDKDNRTKDTFDIRNQMRCDKIV